MNPAAELERGLAALGIASAQPAKQQLLAHLALIEKWNRVHNLTAIRELPRMVSHHVLDSLAVVPHLSASRIADIGSGAGFPGMPLAIVWPQARVTLVESSHKKAAFLRQAVIELGLTNIDIVPDRVERVPPECGFDLVISRAFSDLAEFVRLAGPWVASGGMLAAMKGVYPHEELAQLPQGYRVREVKPLCVPGLQGERHLVLVDRC